MKSVITIFGVVLSLLFIVGSTQGQHPLGPMTMRDYDMKGEITIFGTVVKVARVRDMQRPALQLIVADSKETFEVHLGPADFVDSRMKFREGNAVEIIGSISNTGQRRVVLAREVKKGDQTLKLRDENGFPLWTPPVFIEGDPEDGLRG
jgi:DNA polymerase III alpha subunit